MTPKEEMVMTLLSKETLKRVKKQFKGETEIFPFENFGMSFRLFRTKAGNINLEFLIQMATETSVKENILGVGSGRVQRAVMFFKPIGFYTEKKGIFSNTIETTIVKEFEKEVETLNSNNKLPSNTKVRKLSLKENAVLAAFSMEANIKALKYEDTSFFANGLACDIFLTWEGYPQVFLDDKYGLEGPIAAYKLREENSINPMVYNKSIFDEFYEMSLMTAFKAV